MKRFKAGRSHYNIISTDMGLCQPTSCYEALPGETIQQSTQALIRLLPPQTPVMHPVTVRLHTWQVPIRIIDPEFEDFITGGEDGLYNTPPETADAVTVSEGDVVEAMGVPQGASRTYIRNPAKAFARIYNRRYRDQDLMPEIDEDNYNGNVPPPHIAWEKDRYMAARPWTQKGPEVSLPASEAKVFTRTPNGQSVSVQVGKDGPEDGVLDTSGARATLDTTFGGSPDNMLLADIAATANDYRMMFAVQRWQEMRAQYGSRFSEYLRACGVRSSDARLNEPEYLGGGKQVISFSEVLAHTESDTPGVPLGKLGGHGIAAIRTRPFRRFIEEHSYIITIMSVRPKIMYTQAQHPMWNRMDKMDWFQKELQYVGQEEIYKREINADDSDADGILGYFNRYSSFLNVPSRTSGEFDTLLDSWHMARKFGGNISLNEDLVKCQPTKRVFSDTSDTTNKLWCMVNHSVRSRTPVDPRPRNRII